MVVPVRTLRYKMYIESSFNFSMLHYLFYRMTLGWTLFTSKNTCITRV